MNNDEIPALAANFVAMHGTRAAIAQAEKLESRKRPSRRDILMAAALRIAAHDAR